VASGAQAVRGVRRPRKSASRLDSIRVEKIDRDAQLTTASGSSLQMTSADDVRISTASGSVSVRIRKADVRINALAGTISSSFAGRPRPKQTRERCR